LGSVVLMNEVPLAVNDSQPFVQARNVVNVVP
jgi:hypothetical protein